MQFSYWCNFKNVTYSSFQLSPKLCELYVPKWGDLPKGTRILLCIFILQTWLNLCLQNYIIIIIIYCTYMSILCEIHRGYASFGSKLYDTMYNLPENPHFERSSKRFLWKGSAGNGGVCPEKKDTRNFNPQLRVFDANYCSIHRINT